jgi:hypothetical protein
MSTIDREALLKWLGEQYYREDISHDRARAFLLVKSKIESGRFDAPNEAEERYRESIEGIRRIIQSAESYKTFEELKSVLVSAEWACNEALSTTTDKGVERVKINYCMECDSNTSNNDFCSVCGSKHIIPGINAPEKELWTE